VESGGLENKNTSKESKN